MVSIGRMWVVKKRTSDETGFDQKKKCHQIPKCPENHLRFFIETQAAALDWILKSSMGMAYHHPWTSWRIEERQLPRIFNLVGLLVFISFFMVLDGG